MQIKAQTSYGQTLAEVIQYRCLAANLARALSTNLKPFSAQELQTRNMGTSLPTSFLPSFLPSSLRSLFYEAGLGYVAQATIELLLPPPLKCATCMTQSPRFSLSFTYPNSLILPGRICLFIFFNPVAKVAGTHYDPSWVSDSHLFYCLSFWTSECSDL